MQQRRGLARQATDSRCGTRVSAALLEDAPGLGPTTGERLEAIGVRAWVEALLGDEEACRERFGAAERLADELGVTTPSGGMAAGLLALSRGRFEEAATHLENKLNGGSAISAAVALRPFLDALVEACVHSGRIIAPVHSCARPSPPRSKRRSPGSSPRPTGCARSSTTIQPTSRRRSESIGAGGTALRRPARASRMVRCFGVAGSFPRLANSCRWPGPRSAPSARPSGRRGHATSSTPPALACPVPPPKYP